MDGAFSSESDLEIKTALISVTDKTGMVDFAARLREHGVSIISTGGTLKALRDAGVEARSIEEVTGFPEMLDGRVKTLQATIHAGILADKSDPEHMETIRRFNISPIDMVVCNFYNFTEAAARRDSSLDALIEKIDIGGPTMVNAAAKNHGSVLVVTSPESYGRIADEMDRNGGRVSPETRWRGFIDAVTTVGNYRGAIASVFREIDAGREQQRADRRKVR